MARVLVILALLALAPVPASANPTVTQAVVARIEAEGFTVTEVTRTWLGRILITAISETGLREIVIHRTSGEILRDKVFARLPEPAAPDRPTTGAQAPAGGPATIGPGIGGGRGGTGPGGGPGHGGGGPGGGGGGARE